MRLVPTFATLIAVFSFSSTTTASDHLNEIVIRVPLQRKSFITHSPSPDVTTRANNAVGYVNSDFLKTHVASIGMKYRTAFAAYERNTGFPHPLAQPISAITSGAKTSLPAGRLEKRWRQRDVTSDIPISSNHVLRSPHTKRNDIPLSEEHSNMWMGTISVGTPPQNFTVDFDTGSADLILPDQACDSTCNGHTRYSLADSSTSVNLHKTFQLAYRGGGRVNGIQYADNVYMGGYKAANQTFGSATTYPSALQSPAFPPDGLLGMGFPQISVLGASPVFQTMNSNGVVPQGVFGLALSSETGKSELTIGGTNTALYQESTTVYVNLSLAAFWQIPFTGLARSGLNGAPDVVVVDKASYAQAIVDTGTTLIVTSDSNAQAFYANVTGAKPCDTIGGGVWSVPCDIIDELVTTLTLGSSNFTVSPSTFNLGLVSQGSTDCVAGLAGGGSPYWIIGDVFLQNVYTIFDVDNTRIGFADLT